MKSKQKTIRTTNGRTLFLTRTEYGKAVRKAYENGTFDERWANMKQLEPRTDGICNTITTVQKDNLTLRKVERMDFEEDITEEQTEGKTVDDYLYETKDGECYGIFKLSPRECLRLMDVRDEDIDKMLAVNSNSQCYKQAGNSIVVSVLAALFSQLNIQGIKPWNDRTHEERMQLLGYKHKGGE